LLAQDIKDDGGDTQTLIVSVEALRKEIVDTQALDDCLLNWLVEIGADFFNGSCLAVVDIDLKAGTGGI
jgi:hypothetical protein